jgi:methylated-DNA-[protein]-cysteine S-methyltransferase
MWTRMPIAAPWPLFVATSDQGICGLHIGSRADSVSAPLHPALLSTATQQLAEYLSGSRTKFDIPLDLRGSPFQLAVWAELQSIPYGQTISYAELAIRIGSPKAVRAVGAANGRNPVPILVPCHRVIASNGDLQGFGAGLDVKRALLDLEGAASLQKSLFE